MARNRKRARDRRPDRPDPGAGLATDDAADPLRHAAPDAELAQAQLALGRPELAGDADEPSDGAQDAQEFEDDAGDDDDDFDGAGVGSGSGGGGGAIAVPGGHAADRPRGAGRVLNFVQGSWRELQRVQWPDRRQVMQATGVVVGFVIVAGVFLGAADYVSQQLVKFILK